MRVLMTTVLLMVVLAGAAHGDALTAETTGHRSVAVVCLDPETGLYAVMRAGLVAHDGRGEIAITAAHGLIGRTGCEIRAEGAAAPVRTFIAGADDPVSGDWALVVSDVRLGDALPRYRLAQVSGSEFDAVMVSSRALQPSCRIQAPPDGVFGGEGLALHDCRVLPGRSGAPLVANHNGERFIVAVTLGYLATPDDALNNRAVARLVDQSMADALGRLAR